MIAYFIAAIGAVQSTRSSGLSTWAPLPMFDLTPGTFTKEVDPELPGGYLFQLNGPPPRTIRLYNDTFELFRSPAPTSTALRG